ncbi:MAG: hypothetical protein QOK29_3664, partial [Rhodospirillaceae bacterium]|nr:hypothetical protein [Rhodospirillaceae bacterium]
MSDHIKTRPGLRGEFTGGDGLDRRGVLKCMAWAGAGILWTVSGGV